MAAKKSSFLTKAKVIVLIILAVLLGIVFFQNTETTTLKMLGWKMEAPMVLLFPGLFAIGFLVGVMTLLLYQRSKKKELKASAKVDAALREMEGK